MKTTWFSRRISVALAAGFFLLIGLFAGCGEDEKTDGGVGPGTSEITVEQIIFNPKSPAPGDTLRATAVVTAGTLNVGDFVTYKWTASDGVLLEDDMSSVRWQAPDESAVYSLSVTARNSVNTATASDDVFVGKLENFISERAGELFPMPSGAALYYTSAPGFAIEGLIIRFKDGGVDQPVFVDARGGAQFSFDADRTHAAHVALNPFPRRVIVVHDDLQSKTQTTIASDSMTFRFRPNEYTKPNLSPDGKFICYQGSLLDQNTSSVGVDTFSVFVYDIVGGTTRRVTFKGNSTSPEVSRSFYPTFSSNNKHLVFVSDRSAPSVWELYALPVTGGAVTPDTAPDALVRLSDTGGQMASGTAAPPVGVAQQWNPNPAFPILAVIGVDSKLRLVPTDGSGARPVAAPGKVTDIRWAPNGQYLAACVFDTGAGLNRIYRVTPAGDFEEVSAGVAGDRLTDLTVSPGPDSEFLVYAVGRGSDVWYELVDMRPSGSGKPVRITPAAVPARAADYGQPLQSLRSTWQPGSKTAYLFFLDEDTPRVMTLDLSGIGQ